MAHVLTGGCSMPMPFTGRYHDNFSGTDFFAVFTSRDDTAAADNMKHLICGVNMWTRASAIFEIYGQHVGLFLPQNLH